MSTILLAEQSIVREYRLAERLNDLGHQVTSVADTELLDMIKMHPYDMILWSFAEMEECVKETIRQMRVFTDVPLLRICVLGDCELQAEGMTAFVDGYIDASLKKDDLRDIINDYLRDAYRKSHNVRLYQYKGLKISNGSIKKIEMNHKSLDLTVKEYMILSLLMCHRDCIYTKSSLYESVWRQPYMGDDNAIKIHISNLRSKLKKADPNENYIETVWGQGYRLCKS